MSRPLLAPRRFLAIPWPKLWNLRHNSEMRLAVFFRMVRRWAGRVTPLVFWTLVLLVVLAPLPLGSNWPGGWFLLATGVGVLLVLWSAGLLVARQAPPVAASRVWVALVLFAGVCLWAVVQWLPWTPEAWHHPLWADAGRVLGRELPGRISLNPEETLTALVRLLTYAGVFWLALQLCRSPERARRGLQLFVWAGFAYALYGLFAYFSGADKILWMEKWAYQGVVTSTLVNRNSYATLAGLALVCASALFLDGLGAVLRAKVPARVKARWLLKQLLGPGAPLLVAILVIATALLLTESRGGTLSALLGLVVLMLALLRARALPGRQVAALSMGFLLLGLAVFALSGAEVARRFEHTESSAADRTAVYALVVRAIGDAPVLGTGYGTFPDVFPLYRDDTIAGTLFWRKAHDTYLESALELGIPAALALVAAIGTCAGYCWVGIRRRRRDRIYPAIGVAVTALVAAHSTVDFSLQIPAVSVSYAFLLGMACAQSFPTREA